ncbi:MAG: single-stranded DNA-binding protein [Sphaerobacteraceae bacterium]|nr:MAG: single-stranded DNA-binding protein [Sphaerobacteraceae bacterium]
MSTGRARAHIIGNIGQEPEMRFSQSGTAVTNFTVAVNRTPRNQQGGEEVPPDWYRIVCFGQLAEMADKYYSKGNRVYVEGRLQINRFTGNDGQERQSVEIVANEIMNLTPRGDTQGEGQQQRGGQNSNDDELDDLPF